MKKVQNVNIFWGAKISNICLGMYFFFFGGGGGGGG